MAGVDRKRRRGGRKRRDEAAAGSPLGVRRSDGKPAYARRSLPALALWNWRTFPVAFAFVLGMIVMGVATTLPYVFLFLFFAALFGLAFGLAHILTRTIAARHRQ